MAYSVDEIEELLENAPLSQWEEDFLRDMAEKLDKGEPLTDNQADRLENIIREKG